MKISFEIILIFFLLSIFTDLLSNAFSSPNQYRPKAIVLVDPIENFISGYVKAICSERDIQTIDVVSSYMVGFFAAQGKNVPDSLTAPRPGEEELWAREFAWTDICCVLTESDSGITTAERMQVALSLPGNGFRPELTNKYLTNYACRQSGLTTLKQCVTGNWSIGEEFIQDELFETIPYNVNALNAATENIMFKRQLSSRISSTTQFNSAGSIISVVSPNPSRCIVKPVRGVAGQGVYLCESVREAKRAFEMLLGAATYGGGRNTEVLIEEFAEGIEYAVDTVSRDGVTKVLGLWRIKKRSANCSPFVYQSAELVAAETDVEHSIIDYTLAALRATGFAWGPAHVEVILTADGPRLIEINPRWHAADTRAVMRACYDHDVLTATVDAYTDPEAFAEIPTRPLRLKAYGIIVHLISFVTGEIMSVKHTDSIKEMRSLLRLELFAEEGDSITRTVDTRTHSGYAILSHTDAKVVEEDYKNILQLQPFLYEVSQVESASWANEEFDEDPQSSIYLDKCELLDFDCTPVRVGIIDQQSSVLATSIRNDSSIQGRLRYFGSRLKSSLTKISNKWKSYSELQRMIFKFRSYWKRLMKKSIPLAKTMTVLTGSAMTLAVMTAAMLGFNVR